MKNSKIFLLLISMSVFGSGQFMGEYTGIFREGKCKIN